MTKAPRLKLTLSQLRALVSARDHGSATAHLQGRSAFGGAAGTLRVLRQKGVLDASNSITDAGRERIKGVAPGWR